MPRKTQEVNGDFPLNIPVTFESVKQILVTLIPFALIITALAIFDHWAAYIVLVPLGSIFLLRSFILQHDCGHQALFRRKKTNNIIGSIIGVITLIPYHYWRWQYISAISGPSPMSFRQG